MALDLWKDPAVEKIMRPVADAVTAMWEQLQVMHDLELEDQLKWPEELAQVAEDFSVKAQYLGISLHVAANDVLLAPECPKAICELMIHGIELDKLAEELKGEFDNLVKSVRKEPDKEGTNPEIYRLEFKTLMALLPFRLAMQASGVPVMLKRFGFGNRSTD